MNDIDDQEREIRAASIGKVIQWLDEANCEVDSRTEDLFARYILGEFDIEELKREIRILYTGADYRSALH